jgi:mono/diheme cytochrome c family protein
MTRNRLLLFTGLALIWATTSAQSPTPAGVYTEAQAANGKKSYDRYCADCHHMSLKGSGHGPELAGPNFLAQWGARYERVVEPRAARHVPERGSDHGRWPGFHR